MAVLCELLGELICLPFALLGSVLCLVGTIIVLPFVGCYKCCH